MVDSPQYVSEEDYPAVFLLHLVKVNVFSVTDQTGSAHPCSDDSPILNVAETSQDEGTEPGPIQPVFWTNTFLKNSFLDMQNIL